MKIVDHLKPSDFESYPIWRYAGSNPDGEILVRPIESFPVSDLAGKLVGTELSLAGDIRVSGLVGNVDTLNPESTKHFVTVSIYSKDRWFHLARYHDVDYLERGPEALAKFLQLEVTQVFPIAYDLRRYSKGLEAALVGSVERDPAIRLTESQLMQLVFKHS